MFTLHTTNLTFPSSLFGNEDEPFPSVIVLAKLLRVCSTFFVNKREFSENLRSLEDTIIVENFVCFVRVVENSQPIKSQDDTTSFHKFLAEYQ